MVRDNFREKAVPLRIGRIPLAEQEEENLPKVAKAIMI